MKTKIIGQCKNCKHWDNTDKLSVGNIIIREGACLYGDGHLPFHTSKDFGCLYWTLKFIGNKQ